VKARQTFSTFCLFKKLYYVGLTFALRGALGTISKSNKRGSILRHEQTPIAIFKWALSFRCLQLLSIKSGYIRKKRAVNSLCCIQQINSGVHKVDWSHDFIPLFRMMCRCCLALTMCANCLLGQFKVTFPDFVFKLLDRACCLEAKCL